MPVDLLDQLLPYVKNAIHPARFAISEWKLREGDISGAHSISFRDQSWATTQIPHQWIGDNKTVWFRKEVVVPEQFIGQPLAILLDLHEALLFVDGKIFQGLDLNHKEAFLTEKARANQRFSLAIQSFSGRKRGINTFNEAELVVINRTARALFNGLTALRDLDRLLGHGSQESKDIRELIRRTLIFLKYFKPEGEEYPNAISRAYKFLTGALESEFKTSLQGLVHLIAQSDVDVAWLWTIEEARKKLARTFTSSLRVIEEFPESFFSQSQALTYKLVGDSYPDILKQVKQRLAEGRWEAATPFWVEPDCNIPNGESLARNILYGRRYFKNVLGAESSVALLPNSSGFSSGLPQILRKSGIGWFSTSKLLLNDTTVFPYNNFWWQGIDGSKVLSHIPSVGLEAFLGPRDLRRSWDSFRQKEETVLTTQTFGFGRDGGGIAPEQIEAARILRTMIGLPPSQLSTMQLYFQQGEQQSQNLPVWNNELYLERHRGTFTTQAWIKRENRLCENLLYEAELTVSMAALLSKSPHLRRYPKDELEQAWKLLVQNQYHQILGGTSIADVYDSARKDFANVHLIAEKIIERTIPLFGEPARKSSKEFTFTVLNTLCFVRSEYVECVVSSPEKNFVVLASNGQPIEHQVLERNRGEVRILCFVPNVEPFSAVSFVIRPTDVKAEAVKPWRTSNRAIETPLYKVRIDKKGGLSSLYDKQLRRDLIERGKRGNVLQAFKDTPEQWDAWELTSGYDRQRLEIFKLKNWKFVETGPLRARIRFDFRSVNGSSIIQDILLYHKAKRIDFPTRVNWKERRTLLKVVFPFNVKAGSVTAETQFGAIKRTTKPREEIDRAKFEVPTQRWIDFSEQKLGVSLLNDCKYGYDAHENVIRLTLIRSPLYPHPSDPWHLNDDKCSDLGEHQFTYALYPHLGDWTRGETVLHAQALNVPCRLIPNIVAKKNVFPILVGRNNVAVSCLKKSEDTDDFILRLYETSGTQTDCALKLGFSVKALWDCDLMENNLREAKMTKGKVVLKFRPFEIKTLRLVLRQR